MAADHSPWPVRLGNRLPGVRASCSIFGMSRNDTPVDRRPWGFFEVLAEGPGHKVKRITVYPGQRLSLQRHRHRQEHWFIVSGVGVVTRDGEEVSLTAGMSVDILAGTDHRIANPGTGPLVFVEVQQGDYLGENDIERIDDDYGRIRPESG